ncbi:MAG: rubrerythrin family protein [Duncaniella sp.]|nr:rubrerythrin family protein [Duncaniella sp.]
MADTTATPTAKSIKGTRTEKLLAASYVAESTAYTRYTFYAQQADKEGYYPIGQIFRETADNELHHGKVFFKFLEGGKVPVAADIDAGVIGDTATNLEIAAAEEESEGVDFYRNAAKVAREEGFDTIAERFESIADVEERHRRRFLAYLKQVKDGTVWHRDHPIKWQCLVCGFVFEGVEPPKVCPGCAHPYQHYIALDMDEL